MSKKVLIVDDEKNIANIIAFNFKKEGYDVLCAYDGLQGVNLAIQEMPDLILLDVMMPIMDGYDACRKIREKLNTPIIMLTARAEEIDKVLGLELGADDYVTKPFGIRELLARVKANLRRTVVNKDSDTRESSYVERGEFSIDWDRYEIKKNDVLLDLTHREFEFLKFLMEQEGQIFSRETLLEKVWGYEYFGDARTVDVTIRRIREKLEDDPSNPKHILTKRGVGYYFNE